MVIQSIYETIVVVSLKKLILTKNKKG